MSNVTKTYTLEQVTKLLGDVAQNLTDGLVRIYPSQNRMIDNYAAAYKKAEKHNFNQDIDYEAITPKSDKWRYGFIKYFKAEEKCFEISYDSQRFGWAGDMFENLAKRLDFDTITEWQATTLKTDRVQEEIAAMIGYYRETGYFQTYVKLYDASKNLSEEQYKKLCQNKYAVKVLDAHFADPLFEVGDLVSLRGSDRNLKSRGMHKGMFVLSNTETITSARKGCKKYKLLPVGGHKPLFFEERELKKYKKPKNNE